MLMFDVNYIMIIRQVRAESKDPVVYGGPVQNRNYSVNLNFDVFFMFVYHSNRTNLVCG